MLYPLPPVMVSCGTMEKSNIITVAWTGTVNSEPPMTYVSVRPERHSYAMIKERGEFVINLTTERLVRAADLCGVRSGRDVQKFRFCRLTPAPASAVSAPLIAESPVNIECRVEQRLALGSHDMFLAKVLAVTSTGATARWAASLANSDFPFRKNRRRKDKCLDARYARSRCANAATSSTRPPTKTAKRS